MVVASEKNGSLASRIEIECDRKGISRAELARQLGIQPPNFYAMISRGDVKASLLQHMAKILEVPMEILMTPVDDEEFGDAKVEKRRLRRQNATGAEFFK